MTLNPFPNEARWSVVSLIENKHKESHVLFIRKSYYVWRFMHSRMMHTRVVWMSVGSAIAKQAMKTMFHISDAMNAEW